MTHSSATSKEVVFVPTGSKIMVRCMGSKSSEVELDFKFKTRQWYHVTLTLSSGSALTPGWARLYVDGVLEASERFKYPKVDWACPEVSGSPVFRPERLIYIAAPLLQLLG